MDVHEEWKRFEQSYRYLPRNSKEVEAHYIRHVIRLLQAQGWAVFPMKSNEHFDLTIARNGQVLQIEVKIARPKRKPHRSTNHYYQFKIRSGGIRSCDGDFCILAACPNGVSSMTVFIIPTDQLGERCVIEITSDPLEYKGRWAVYRNAWEMLTGPSRLGLLLRHIFPLAEKIHPQIGCRHSLH
jgi:hypothetical protein